MPKNFFSQAVIFEYSSLINDNLNLPLDFILLVIGPSSKSHDLTFLVIKEFDSICVKFCQSDVCFRFINNY